MLLKNCQLFFLAFICLLSPAFSQQYNFVAYNVDEGLPQSQVFGLMQSEDRQLWLSTYGGISRFDGKTFYNYGASDGLSASYPIHFTIDHYGKTWAITNSKLHLIEGDKIYSYALPDTVLNGRARLAVTGDNVLWCLVNGVLYSFRKDQFTREDVEGVPNHGFFSLLKGEKKNIFLMAPRRTLYKYEAGAWKRHTVLNSIDSTQRINNIYFDSLGAVWVVTGNKLMVKYAHSEAVQTWFSVADKHTVFTCLTKDRSGNFWVGTNSGAYRIKQDKSFSYFNDSNGFSDYLVSDIITDEEGNIWFGTNGDGLLKYGGGMFTSYSSITGPAPRAVHAVSYNPADESLLFGNSGSDFCFLQNGVRTYPFRNSALHKTGIMYVHTASSGALWLGTQAAGIWKYENKQLRPTEFSKNTVHAIYEAGPRIFFSADNGLIMSENNTLRKIPGINEFTNCMISAGNDSLLVSTQSGFILLKDTVQLPFSYPSLLQQVTISAFEKKNDRVFIGTLGAGIYVWSKTTGNFSSITTANGLYSNIIYSLKFDHRGQLWAGTGSGVCRISLSGDLNTVRIRNYGKEEGFKGLECNQHAIAVSQHNEVWFGTSRGLYCYHPEEEPQFFTAPKLALQAIKLFSKPMLSGKDTPAMAQRPYSQLPASPVLSSDQNHITFEFRAISYSHSNIRYSYFLQGLEKQFSVPDLSDFVVYPSLPPGKYVFNVKATDASGRQLGNMIKYPFEITQAYYRTLWFKLGILSGITAILFAVYWLRRRAGARQQKLVETLRSQEQLKIRKKTAQDFHDEMGNKLARITVLSDILNTKLAGNEEAQGLSRKIQENAALLYQGTKDMIWSLNPANDNLYLLLKYVNDFGVDLFIDSEMEFIPMQVDEMLKAYFLPMDYARNMIMICKEIFTNILKHSQCRQVKTGVAIHDRKTLRLSIHDDGKGFNPSSATKGNGLINIYQRAEYLQATLELQSEAEKGTCIVINFTLPLNETFKK